MALHPKRIPREGVDEYGRTPLWHLAFKGDVDAIRAKIITGADTNLADDAGYTPLHIAVQERHSTIVSILLDAGADPNRTDKHGNNPLWTAVYWACRRDRTDANLEIIGFLLRGGGDKSHKNRVGRSPQDFALEAGDAPVRGLFEE